ncbi:MAG TPA: MlaD family protein [Vicinamibacterales bacterium]|nr:MlaD family protein [Vicinamibacterales bacterium]
MGRKSTAVVGAFVVGGVLLFAVGLFLIGERRLLFSPRFELYTTFTKVSGLQVGTKVRVAGLDAGEVLEIQIPPEPADPFRVRMRLRDDLRPLVRTDSVSAVQTDGIVGNALIQIGRGSNAAPMVEPGDTIAGRDAVEFSDLLEEGRLTFQAVSRQVEALGEEMTAVVGDLGEVARSTNELITDVGSDVQVISAASVEFVEDGRRLLADARGMAENVRAGQGSVGKLLTDDTLYERLVSIADEAEQTMVGVRETTGRARDLVEGIGAPDGAAQQIVQSLRDTLADTREVMSDLSENTEALKRNFLFRGFFRDRGFFDLNSLSREAYAAGALLGSDRTALRVWIDAAGLFTTLPDGTEQLTADGRRRIDSAMADLVRYPRESPLVVEGYMDAGEGGMAYLVSADRAETVREYLLTRFRRQVTLTGAMPMGTDAAGSPRGDNRWAGVALTLFVRLDAVGR